MISNKIKVYRVGKNWTQEELAFKVGVTRQTILAIEKNKYVPSLLLAFKIASKLGQPLEKVFIFTKKENQDGKK